MLHAIVSRRAVFWTSARGWGGEGGCQKVERNIFSSARSFEEQPYYLLVVEESITVNTIVSLCQATGRLAETGRVAKKQVK